MKRAAAVAVLLAVLTACTPQMPDKPRQALNPMYCMAMAQMAGYVAFSAATGGTASKVKETMNLGKITDANLSQWANYMVDSIFASKRQNEEKVAEFMDSCLGS